MKYICTFFQLLFVSSLFATQPNKITIKLDDDQKYLSMTSVDNSQKESFHFINYETKNEETYGLKTVFVDQNNDIHELPDYESDEKFDLVSFS